MRNMITKIFGWRSLLVNGDSLVLDRWMWLSSVMPKGVHDKYLLDVGCGNGVFTMGLADRGFSALGLSWNQASLNKAENRANLCRIASAKFQVQDVRELGTRSDLKRDFDYIVCLENIEHIIDDKKLMQDMSACLKPEGRLFLTTPNINFIAISREDKEPLSIIEDGGHVRRGYSASDLETLCQASGLTVKDIGYVSGYASQKLTKVLWVLRRVHPVLAYILVLPFRWIPPIIDMKLKLFPDYPRYSITLIAEKLLE